MHFKRTAAIIMAFTMMVSSFNASMVLADEVTETSETAEDVSEIQKLESTEQTEQSEITSQAENNDDEAYKYLFDTLKDKVNESELLNYIKLDYLLKNKIKPKIWWEYSLNKEDRNKYFKLFNSKFNIDLQTFYNYSYLDIIDNNILLFIYKDNKVTLLKGN